MAAGEPGPVAVQMSGVRIVAETRVSPLHERPEALEAVRVRHASHALAGTVRHGFVPERYPLIR